MDFTESILNSPKMIQHTWHIEGFTKYYDFINRYKSLTISSDIFKISNCGDDTFFYKLTIFSHHISCFLYRCSTTKFSCLSCNLWLQSGDRYMKSQHFVIDKYEDQSKPLATLTFESVDLLFQHKRKILFPDDNLTIIGEFKMLNNSTMIESVYTPRPCKLIKHDFEEILYNGSGSDIIFEVDGEEFKAHKLIVSARSPVFAAMFQHNMVENKTNRVKIEDIPVEAFKLLLHFIYTDVIRTDLDVEIGILLLQAAHKYQLDYLQNLCEEKLFQMLTIDNSDELRSVAEALDLTYFLDGITTFIKLFPKQN